MDYIRQGWLGPEKLVSGTATYLGVANVSNGKDIGLSFQPQVRVNLQATFGIHESAELSISQPRRTHTLSNADEMGVSRNLFSVVCNVVRSSQAFKRYSVDNLHKRWTGLATSTDKMEHLDKALGVPQIVKC